MTTPVLLSAQGSDRATAYNMSCKLMRRDDVLLAAWLERPNTLGAGVRIRVGVCVPGGVSEPTDVRARLVSATELGAGVDNHCGPALALDGDRRVHLICGAHHHDFGYRWTDDPADPASWSAPVAVDGRCSYPALVVDAEGTLHLAYRESGDRWQLRYRRKPRDAAWEAPRILIESPSPGYNHFMQSLSFGPSGTLHLVCQLYYTPTGAAADLAGRGIAYLFSDDGGDTWYNEANRLDAPGTADTLQLVCRQERGVSVSNHIIDADDQPWVVSCDPGSSAGLLWQRTASGWQARDLGAAFDAGQHTMQGASLSRDAAGVVHAILPSRPDGRQAQWSDAGCELFHLSLGADGDISRAQQVTPTDAAVPSWLPSLETWDWRRGEVVGDGGHWLLYTHGHNTSSAEEGGCANLGATEVCLTRLVQAIPDPAAASPAS